MVTKLRLEVSIKKVRRVKKNNDGPLKNEEITFEEIRVVGAEGEALGILSSNEAIEIAKKDGLDLIVISENAVPPVCKIVDYGKYKYELQKKEKESKRKQTAVQTKEIKMKPHIDKHDVQIKLNHAIEFLEHGHRVKLRMMFFGRMLAHVDIGREVIEDFVNQLRPYGKVILEPIKEGNNINALVGPKSNNQKKKDKKKGETKDEE